MTRFDEVKQLAELEAKATPARWSLTQYSDDILEISREDGTRGFQILFEDSDIDDPQFITDLRNAAPWLLQIAEAFQPGDGKLIGNAIAAIRDSIEDLALCEEEYDEEIEVLRRLMAACEEMEDDA